MNKGYPLTYTWTSYNNELFSLQSYDNVVEPFSVISGLFPGNYCVQITDDMGCILLDTIEVKSNPQICIAYAAFSPNDK